MTLQDRLHALDKMDIERFGRAIGTILEFDQYRARTQLLEGPVASSDYNGRNSYSGLSIEERMGIGLDPQYQSINGVSALSAETRRSYMALTNSYFGDDSNPANLGLGQGFKPYRHTID